MRFLGPPDAGDRIDAHVPMELSCGPGPDVRLRVALAFHRRDPMVLRLTFDTADDVPVTWAVSRDLLLDGLDGPAGLGDVRVSPHEEDPELVRIRLRSPGGTAELLAPAAALHAVLLRTGLLVPFGEESCTTALERELALLLQSTEG